MTDDDPFVEFGRAIEALWLAMIEPITRVCDILAEACKGRSWRALRLRWWLRRRGIKMPRK